MRLSACPLSCNATNVVRILGPAEGLIAGGEALDCFECGLVGRQIPSERPGKPARQGTLGQLKGVAEMAAGQGRVVKVLERDPAEGDVDPEVVAAALKSVTEGVASGFDVAGFQELDSVLVVELALGHAPRVDDLE